MIFYELIQPLTRIISICSFFIFHFPFLIRINIVGTGIQLVGHLTLAAEAWIKQADKVLFALADPVTAKWLKTLNASAEALPYNANNERRRETYREMVERTMTFVRRGLNVCAVFYGHPGVFADPAHNAIRVARREGFRALMAGGFRPWRLFADLGLDSGRNSCQNERPIFSSSRRRQYGPHSALIRLQIAKDGHLGPSQEGPLTGFSGVGRGFRGGLWARS